METIRGTASRELNLEEFTSRLAGCERIILDLGTGDGRYVHSLAEKNPAWFVMGLDPCRENLRKHSRAKLPNMLFVIASAHKLPPELNGLVSHITINFPWGSLLEGLLTGDSMFLSGIETISRPAAEIDLRLNSGALAEAGWSLEAGTGRIRDNLLRAGWQIRDPSIMNANTLKSFPSTWAKRLAFGRDPRATAISGLIGDRSKRPLKIPNLNHTQAREADLIDSK